MYSLSTTGFKKFILEHQPISIQYEGGGEANTPPATFEYPRDRIFAQTMPDIIGLCSDLTGNKTQFNNIVRIEMDFLSNRIAVSILCGIKQPENIECTYNLILLPK